MTIEIGKDYYVSFGGGLIEGKVMGHNGGNYYATQTKEYGLLLREKEDFYGTVPFEAAPKVEPIAPPSLVGKALILAIACVALFGGGFCAGRVFQQHINKSTAQLEDK